MKISRRMPHYVTSMLVFCAMSQVLLAQDAAQSTDRFEHNGEVTVGYRFTDISGYRPQYLQVFDLRKGLRVQDFAVYGKALRDSALLPDEYSVNGSGLGGDPFATAGLKISKRELYDLRVQWRQSYYYRNQNDDVILPITSAAPALSKGLTDNHDWATVRKLGSVALTFHVTNNLRLSLDYFRTTTDGSLLTTRSLDFFNAPSFWGSFARANPYPLNAPLRDETNRIAGGVDYSLRNWDFHYRGGNQWFHEATSLNLVTSGEVSINPVTLSTTEPLDQLSWSQTRKLRAPISDFSFRGDISNSLEWRGSYSYSRHRGPAELDMAFAGIAPASNGTLTPYTVSETGRANVAEPNHIASQGFSWRLREWLTANVDYRYSRYTSHSEASVQSVFNGGTPSAETNEVIWRNGLSDLDFNLLLTPIDNLVLRPGIRLSKSDIATFENNVIDDARTLRTKHVRPEFRFGYRPWSRLSIRGDFHSSTSGASYNAITPHSRISGRLITRVDVRENLSIENSLTISTARLDDASYRNRVRSNAITVSYALDERFSTFGSFGYESFFATGEIVYARGTSPLRSTLRDQEIHRVWQAGIDFRPKASFGVRASANFDRMTGVGEIIGEPPAYGPVTWPLGTVTFYYELPKAGRLWLDLQRTYYIEEIVPANNFSANLLTIRFTRTF